jgi:hypothetical protein
LERRKITIARLRSGVNYKQPLDHILDSYYYLLERFHKEDKQFMWGFYNFGFNAANRRIANDVPTSDIIIIPSENEFHYHIKDDNGKSTYIDPKNLQRSDDAIKEHILPHIKNKHIVILRSDRGDDERLYREKTFKNLPVRKVSILDETDIPGNVHQLKYHFIRDYIKQRKFNEKSKPLKFCYFGTEKRNDDKGKTDDERHIVLKEIYNGEGTYNTRFYGRFSNIKRNDKSRPMKKLIRTLLKTKFTLCFNWKDNKATTSRYHESIACGVIPMVYKDYDSTGILVKDDWQRVSSAKELMKKMSISEVEYKKKQQSILESYKQSLLTKDEIYDTFKKRFLQIINE